MTSRLLATIFVICSILSSAVLGNDLVLTEEQRTYLQEHRDITVGVSTTSWSPYFDIDQLGAYSGINIDYLENIAQQLDIRLHYKSYSSVQALLHAVEDKQVDVAVGYSRTPEREERFAFSAPFFSGTIAAWYRKKQFAFLEQKELKWTCVQGTVYCQYISQISAGRLIPVGSFNEAVQLVNDGRADAVVANFVSLTEYLDNNDVIRGSIKIPDWLPSESVGLITAIDNPRLVELVDLVLTREAQGLNKPSIASQNPYHQSDKFLTAYREQNPLGKRLIYSMSESAFPILFKNQQGQLDGMLPDFLSLLQARSGLSFQFYPAESELSLTRRPVDFFPVAYSGSPVSDDWLISQPFYQVSYSELELRGQPSAKNKALKQGILMHSEGEPLQVLDNTFEGIQRYSNIQALLHDLVEGQIRSAYVPRDVAKSLLLQTGLDKFALVQRSSLTLNMAFALDKHNPFLLDVLNSVLETVDNNEVEKLVRSYRQFQLVYGYEKAHVLSWAFAVALIVVLILIASFFAYSNLRLKISASKQKIAEGEGERKWLQTIINELPYMVFIHDDQHQLILSNCARYRSGDCRRCLIQDYFTQTPCVEDFWQIQRVLEHDEQLADDCRTQSCQLGLDHVHRERKSIKSATTGQKFVLTVIQDISEQKERENALIEAEKAAQSAVVARERFLATISHELRTPIVGLLGSLEIAQRYELIRDVAQLLEQAERSSRHLNLLVDEILDFSKLEAGALSIEPRSTFLLQTLGETLRSFEPKAHQKGLQYEINIHPFSAKSVLIDATRLTQILSNLLSNAIKFTQSGSVSVYVLANHSNLDITVEDTGIGMSQQQISLVTAPFVQADNTISRRFGGTGLGLSIVDKLITCMQGQWSIESEVGSGTKVHISLPFTLETQFDGDFHHVGLGNLQTSFAVVCDWAQWLTQFGVSPAISDYHLRYQDSGVLNLIQGNGEQPIGETLILPCYPDQLYQWLADVSFDSDRSTSSNDLPPVQFSGHVLVAEDNPINQNIMARQLAALGVEVTLANDGHQAWSLLQQNQHGQIDLLITDVHMPNMDGYQLAEVVRESAEWRSLPIIACTAEDSRLARFQSEQKAIDAVLCKPYTLESLASLLMPFLLSKQALHSTLSVPTAQTDSSIAWLGAFCPAEAREIATIFINTMQMDIEKLREQSDEGALRATIHRIKGGASAVGAEEIRQLCIEGENVDVSQLSVVKQNIINRVNTQVESVIAWQEQRVVGEFNE
ncbi:ATP-binding protein [Vibrio astriarenae]|uniref:ATP-binding protein n=1 Tax=Vibrio astriarenae TaxID=1481923 RepID=UPI0037361A52